ncbi:Leucine-rich repeat protein kinase family protein [Euphorbia peplus]|nr:Leucine-rich repeat protein kinase family protein [Euphorbia peplus]
MSFFIFLLYLLPLLLLPATFALNTDGILLLSFKYSTLSDPLSALESWNYNDETPCSWNGITCTQLGFNGTPDMFRVTSLILPGNQLLGSIPSDLGFIEHLKHIDLSNNFLNGSLPSSFFNSTELQVMSLSGNEISGELPELIGGMKGLKLLNLSDNALAGRLPQNLTRLQNLTVVSLRSNYFSGPIPGGFDQVQSLDLSSNLFNGSLPLDFGGENLGFLNLSWNKLSGAIPDGFGDKIPPNSTIDLSFNNLTGPIPTSSSLLNQKMESFKGNADLCGKPLKNLCSIPSTLSSPPNISISTTTSPAIAVIPRPLESENSSTPNASSEENQTRNGLKPATIVAITVADLAGIAFLALAILYVYQLKKKKSQNPETLTSTSIENPPKMEKKSMVISKMEHQEEPRKPNSWPCLPMKKDETSEEEMTNSDSDGLPTENENFQRQNKGGGKLVILDGETELDMETLLKASAYILGATGASIVYKAVIADGNAFAVRRIGDIGIDRFKDFENRLRLISKLRHPNLVRVRGFYWGDDEKLVIYDYISNGSLGSFSSRKTGSSPFHFPLEIRFKIARGIARCLAFIHEKKHVHGSIKPSNILLTPEMEPIISDFGLDRLVFGNKTTNSGRNLGSQRSDSILSPHPNTTTSPFATPSSSSTPGMSPYQAPESLKNLKPTPKWDVYSYGVVLIELLTGRVFSDRELSQWSAVASSIAEEDKSRVLRLAEVAIRADVEAKEEAMMACFRLGFNCASFVAQKRPSMKEVVQVLEKIPL